MMKCLRQRVGGQAWLWVAILMAVATVSVSCGPAQPEKKGGPEQKAQGPLAPDFTLSALNGGSIRLSDFRGKVVILDFWATWCPPCRMEIPHFIALYDKYRSRGLEVIGIALDTQGAVAVEPFAKSQGINYPLALGDGKVAEAYGGIRGIPTTFIVDRSGRIAEKYVGYREQQVFESAIEPLL